MTEQTGEIIITLDSDEKHFQFEDFNIDYNTPSDEILEAVYQPILEEFGVNIKEDQGDFVYTVKKVEKSGNVYIFPKSPAGTLK